MLVEELENKSKFNREEILASLKEGTCKAVFKKKDGTERVLICTLKEDVLSELFSHTESDNATQNKPKRKVNPDVVLCVDLEKKAFRSFRLDTLISFEANFCSNSQNAPI